MALVLSTAQVRAVDQAAEQRLGVPALVLMENAGRGVAEVIAARLPALGGLPVVVVCGAGQNGGDGFVIARHLANRGARVRVMLALPREKVTGAAAQYLAAAERTPGVAIEDHAASSDPAAWQAPLANAAVVVDALFGTGLRAEIRGVPALAIAAMNASPGLRVAVDVPSGLDADAGVPPAAQAPVVKADLTVTMGALKPGLLLDPLAPVGELHTADLGVNVQVLASGPLCHYLDDQLIRGLLRPQGQGGHKGTRGHVLLVAGSPGKTGAAALAARAAFRAGAGLVTVASTADGQRALDAKVMEAMTACYTGGADADQQSFDQVAEISRRMKAAAVGPGIPTGAGMKALVRRLAGELCLPLVLDADALNLLGLQAAAVLRTAPAPRLLTPHPGEMSRLMGLTTSQVQADRLGVARRLAGDSGAVVVLKGARTVIALPDGDAFINPTADPALGTAGSGDVLTGLLAGLLAQGLAPDQAAPLGVYVHGQAGGDAARTLGSRHIMAGELPEAIARVLEQHLAVAQPDDHRAGR